MAAWPTVPYFYSNSSQYLSASDLNRLREAARLIDGWTYVNAPPFMSSYGLDTNTPGYYRLDDPLRIWWGGVRMVAGCTTLTVEARGVKTGAEQLAVYVGGTDVSGSGTKIGTIALPGTLGDVSGSWSIAGLGLNDGDITQVEIRVEGGHTGSGTYIVRDIYLSPISKSGWVAAPAFADAEATDPTKLNQLATAAQWCYDRLRLVPRELWCQPMFNLGPYKETGTDPQHTDRPMFFLTTARYHSAASFRLRGWVNVGTCTDWFLYVQINGATVWTSPHYGVGNQLIDQTFSLSSYTLGSRPVVAIYATSVHAGTASPLLGSRYSFGVMHSVANWPYATLPAAFPIPSDGTISAHELALRLSALSTIVNDAKARIDARPELFGRSRAMRRYATRNRDTEDLLVARARPTVWHRAGSELFVKGKDIQICYGPMSVKPDERFLGWEGYTFAEEKQVDGAENGVTAWLDNFEGADYGTTLTIKGDPIYAAEYIG